MIPIENSGKKTEAVRVCEEVTRLRLTIWQIHPLSI